MSTSQAVVGKTEADQGLIVRPEGVADTARIRSVHAESFATEAEAQLVDLLRAAGKLTVSLVAARGEAVVGHVAFSPVYTASEVTGVGLAPIAVVPAHRGRGVAATLVEEGIDACRKAGVRWVAVLGDPQFYSRFGFRPGSEFGLADEYGGGPAFQALALVPDGIPKGAGLVRYAPEFAAFG